MSLRLKLAILVFAALLAGCAGALRWDHDSYRVQAGDTLYSIAWRFDIDYHDLARWNHIDSDYTIYPGQELSLTGPAVAGAAPAAVPAPADASAAPQDKAGAASPAVAGPLRWQWPTDGRIVAGFDPAKPRAQGVDIGGEVGQPIHAAADGKVVYSGSGLIGYGKLIIIKHDETYLSAYAYNDVLYVKQGDTVHGGDIIARMGTGPHKRPRLHFEIRRDGKPVDPTRYLPQR